MPGTASSDKMKVLRASVRAGRPNLFLSVVGTGKDRQALHSNSCDSRGSGVMPSQSRNMPEQEHSIRARSDELFVEEIPVVTPARSSRPFVDYLRETPAQPLSPALKALFWMVAIIVGILFLVAIWRVFHHHGRVPAKGPSPARVATSGDGVPGVAAGRRAA